MERKPMTSDAGRPHLDGGSGRTQWRSLEELSRADDFEALVETEFPSLAPIAACVDRRALLKVMGASMALAGLSACSRQPDEQALPYVRSPEFVVPGNPKYYATAVTMGGYAQPVIGKTDAGRPVKLEGNPEHPATGGATDLFLQAALIGLYDPERSQAPRRSGRPASWDDFDTTMTARARALDASEGAGFRLLTGTVTSPTLQRQIETMMTRWPRARWHRLEPVNDDRRREALMHLFRRPLEPHFMLDTAEVVVSLDDDLLGPGPHQAVHARRWSTRRRAFREGKGICRLFTAEPTPSITGAMADERLIAGAGRIEMLARALAHRLGLPGDVDIAVSEREKRWIEAAAAALRAHPGRALVTIGAGYAPQLQALGFLVNERIGAFGKTLRFTDPLAADPPDGMRSIDALVDDMNAGRVSTLAILGVNPAYSTPAGAGFGDALEKVELRIHAGLHYDETAALSHWHVPLEHDLETWSDARAVDGTVSVIQPLVRPFYSVRSQHTIVENLFGRVGDRIETVRATWKETWGHDFDERWREALLQGFVAASAPAFVDPEIATRDVVFSAKTTEEGLSLVVRPDPTVWDGRFGANAWLQETPKPLSKLTWGNAILVSPHLADERRIETGDELRLEVGGRAITGPAWIMPGQEARTVAVTLGYGRSRGGGAAEGEGYDAYALLSSAAVHLDGVVVAKTGEKHTVASTQRHQAMDGYDFVRTVDAPDDRVYKPDLPAPEKADARAPTFYPVQEWTSPSWGMSIDLDACIGCNACVVACMAENNVPVVGKELVAQGREMHWLRVDHYYEGSPEDPKSYFQPVPCMHCEQAPCEMGCPVNAAVHSHDGLNLQVYNRCIGTRTCSSFCPYKVRRFNWFDYTGDDPESVRAMRNPDVTVRQRGVMEKCTYCLQRISDARIAAKKEGRAIRDGEVKTACQQACPTQAIVFGDVKDPGSEVSRLKESPRDYSLLEDVNTWPRTTYLARVGKKGDGEASG